MKRFRSTFRTRMLAALAVTTAALAGFAGLALRTMGSLEEGTRAGEAHAAGLDRADLREKLLRLGGEYGGRLD